MPKCTAKTGTHRSPKAADACPVHGARKGASTAWSSRDVIVMEASSGRGMREQCLNRDYDVVLDRDLGGSFGPNWAGTTFESCHFKADASGRDRVKAGHAKRLTFMSCEIEGDLTTGDRASLVDSSVTGETRLSGSLSAERTHFGGTIEISDSFDMSLSECTGSAPGEVPLIAVSGGYCDISLDQPGGALVTTLFGGDAGPEIEIVRGEGRIVICEPGDDLDECRARTFLACAVEPDDPLWVSVENDSAWEMLRDSGVTQRLIDDDFKSGLSPDDADAVRLAVSMFPNA